MQHIAVETRNRITTITLNRPDRLNAINSDMHDELEAAFNAFATDPEQFICVVTGAGRGFCAGSDLKAASEGDYRPYPAHGYAGLIAGNLKSLGARGCCLVGHPPYYPRFGFRNVAGLALPGVPPEAFFALSFDGRYPRGTVCFHDAFRAEGPPAPP